MTHSLADTHTHTHTHSSQYHEDSITLSTNFDYKICSVFFGDIKFSKVIL